MMCVYTQKVRKIKIYFEVNLSLYTCVSVSVTVIEVNIIFTWFCAFEVVGFGEGSPKK